MNFFTARVYLGANYSIARYTARSLSRPRISRLRDTAIDLIRRRARAMRDARMRVFVLPNRRLGRFFGLFAPNIAQLTPTLLALQFN